MSIPGSASPLLLASTAAAAGGYQISRSLRFNSADSANLSRTPAVAGNRRTWTWAAWVKRSGLGSAAQSFLCSSDSATASAGVFFGVNSGGYGGGAADALTYYEDRIGAQILTTAAVFRDVSAWYHIVVSVDTTQATSTNRVKIYINSVQQTLSGTYPVQNYDSEINRASFEHSIGKHPLSGLGWQFNGCLAECYLIDGQQLTPSSFTEVSATTGQLIPKTYTGTFGTNGFWLKFSDNSAATAATLGKDYSGNSNNWTPNNLSVTAGAGNDSLVDTPTSTGTDTGVGGEVRGNYCTFNPLDINTGTLSNGNLDISGNSGIRSSTFYFSSGKWYFEYTVSNISGGWIAVGAQKHDSDLGNFAAYRDNGQYYNGSGWVSYGASYNNGDVIGVAFDRTGNTIEFFKNGTSQGSLSRTFTIPVTPVINQDGSANFGQRAFAYTAPSGFKALCDTNLGAPVVAKPNTVMDVKLYTGNGSTQTISGLGFSPDLVWTKSRSNGYSHNLQDAVRGFTTGKKLGTNLTFEEGNATELADTNGYISSQTSDGYVISIASSGSGLNMNASGLTYVAWAWDAGTSTVSNTAGSITSQVRANPSAGFSVVTFTAQSSGSGTIGHGLGVTPEFVIVKSRAGAYSWIVWHKSLTSAAYSLILNTTAAQSNGIDAWNSTLPTSSVFSLGSGYAGASNSVAYCFAPVVGYSSFGSYVGNGLADGPFVYTGFRPRWVMIKRSSGGANGWHIADAARSPDNLVNEYLYADTSNSEFTNGSLDFLSNGFKLKADAQTTNNSGVTYVYACFAESPFQYARAR